VRRLCKAQQSAERFVDSLRLAFFIESLFVAGGHARTDDADDISFFDMSHGQQTTSR
jgi:hypothetical protein